MTSWLLLASLASAVEVSGTVRVRGSGDPIEGITVRDDGDENTSVTDFRGRFVLDLPEGQVLLWFESVDTAPVSVELTVPAQPVVVFLEPGRMHEIVVESFRDTAHTARHVVDAEMALETPGTLEDSVRLVQSLPGVSVRREYSPGQAELSVRGSQPGENRYLLDGVDVPYLYHFNQYASVFPTTQIDTLELFPSTFGSAYGDAVGAVIDAKSVVEKPNALHGSVAMSTVMGSASLSAPLEKGDWWLSASGRRSYQDLITGSTEQYTVWPVFGDFSLRAGRERDGKRMQVFAWGGSDAYDRAVGELDLLDAVESDEAPSFAYRRAFQVAGIQTGRNGETGQSRMVNAIVHDRLSGEMSSNGSEVLQTVRLNHRTDVAHQLNGDKLRVEGGWSSRADWTQLQVVDPGPAAFQVAQEAPALARGVATDAKRVRIRGAGYSELHWQQGNWRMMPGLRIPLDSMALVQLPEPRLALRWRGAEQSALKLSFGRYNQAPATEHLIEGTGDPDHPVITAWQAAAGVEQTFANRLEFSVDGYYKLLDNPLWLVPDGPAVTVDRGDAWGFELVSRYRLREVFFLWGWFAYSRSTLDLPEGRVPTNGDQPVTAGVVASWDPGKGWNVGLRYRYGSGLPYTPISNSLYNGTEDTWIPVPSTTNSARLPQYQKLDLHFEKAWVFDRWTLSTYVEGWVVPKSSAQLYPTWNYDYREQGWVVGPTFLPLLGARAKF